MPGLLDAPATLVLIILNVAFSAAALLGSPHLFDRASFKTREILQGGEYYRMVSAGFIHVGLGHLFFNMLTLFFFGPTMEQVLGAGKYYVLYFGSMLAAHGFALFMQRRNPGYAAVGASGAVSGVVFAYCLFQPFAMIFVFFVPMWSIIYAVVYVVGSVYAMKQAEGVRGGIAHEAHIGGAVGGVLIALALEPRLLPHFLNQVAQRF